MSEVKKYSDQLYSIRGLSILSVLYSHFCDKQSLVGDVGVKLFFVLSGFLITGILLSISRSRETTPARWKAMVNFYVRRALRIWPAYFALLGVALIVNIQHIRDVGLWHATFTSNILFSIRNDYVPWVAAPWWTLGVEEQFYLVWPLALVFSGPRFKLWLILGALPLAIGFHVAMVASGHTGLAIDFLPPASMDALGAGALLAWSWRRGPPAGRRLGIAAFAAIGIAAVLLLTFHAVFAAKEVLLVALFALVAGAAAGVRGPLGWVLDWPPLRFIGRISFGVYLYHMFVMAVMLQLPLGNGMLSQTGPWMFAVAGSITIVVAAVSWYCWEAPINRLKHAFPY